VGPGLPQKLLSAKYPAVASSDFVTRVKKVIDFVTIVVVRY